MTDNAEHFIDHIDHIAARIDCIKFRLALNARHDKWPMMREEYLAIAERLDGLAALCRQHVGAFDHHEQMDAEVKARMAA